MAYILIEYFLNLLDHIVMRLINIFFILFLGACALSTPLPPVTKPEPVRITEINPNKWTALTRQNLQHLFQIYDLDPIIFTKKIYIRPKAIQRSHPVLTLNTRYAQRPDHLLGAFIHEQLHWWVAQKKQEMTLAQVELKKLFPDIPPKVRSANMATTYEELMICFLEYHALIFYLKTEEANKVVNDRINRHHPLSWHYRQAQSKFKMINLIAHKHDLIPKYSRPSNHH